MEYTMTDRIYDLTLGKIDNYIATKRSPKYIEMVRAEIKKIDPNNLEDTEKLKEFIENKVPYLIKSNENFMLTLLKENEELPNIRKAIAKANYATNSKKVMNEIFKYSEIGEFHVLGRKLENDKDFVLLSLKNNYKGFNTHHNISEELKNDREVMIEACKYCNEKSKVSNEYSVNMTNELGDKLKNNKDFILEIINKEFNKSLDLEKLIESFTDDKEVMSAYLEKYPRSFHLASERLKNDKDIALIVAEKEPYFAGEYIPRELYKDKEILKKLGPGIDYYKLSEEQLKDKEIALLLVKEAEIKLDQLPRKIRQDKEVVLEAVKVCGSNLEYAPQFVSDREVVLSAVKSDGLAIEFSSKRFTDDKEIMLEAVKENGKSLNFASERLREDPEVVLAAVKQNGRSLEFSSEALKNNKEIVIEAVKNSSWAIEYASPVLQNDPEIVMEAVKKNGLVLNLISDEMKSNPEIVLEAIKNNGENIKYASETVKNNKEIMLAAVKTYGLAIAYAPEQLRLDKEIALEAVKENGTAIVYLPDTLRDDKDIARTAIKTNVVALEYISDRLKNDIEVVLEAYSHNKNDYYNKPNYEVLSDEIKAKYTEDDLFKMAYEKNEKEKENIDIKENISEVKKEVETSKYIEPEKIKESETKETKAPEKAKTVEKKVENSKPKEVSKERATRSRSRATGNER
ncbi:DUF4116 domain-containing protein [uncultured Fusobacterium sp.]|uniref:DUF4116 domain-containing protein n=1 Tax=uncultured Fusobacterium sp. TaxID=159267 RepID=UPI00265E3E10|nr:DUF4116 domain-containing protein [uncultured Fusobacterium sp.]